MPMRTPSATPSGAAHIAALLRQLAWAEFKIQALEAAFRLERIRKYGPASEALTSAQLALLEQEPGVSTPEVAAECGRRALSPTAEPLPVPASSSPRRTSVNTQDGIHSPSTYRTESTSTPAHRSSVPAHLAVTRPRLLAATRVNNAMSSRHTTLS